MIISTSFIPSFFPFFSIFRMSVGKLQPPVIPFMPLLLKDMTFAHEGNKTSVDGLVNFEKMHMMASTMRAVRFCRSRHLGKLTMTIAVVQLTLLCKMHSFVSSIKQFLIHPHQRTMTHKFVHTLDASV